MGARNGIPDLLVVVDDARAARRTIERLSRAGVDGGAITLLGRVEVVTAGRAGDRQVDRGASLALGARALRGLLWGLPPGALFGLLLLQATSQPGTAVTLAGLGGGAVFGAGIGILTAMLTLPTMATSWERTFAPMVPGGVALGIRGTDPRTFARAHRVTGRCGARSVREVVDLDDLPDGLVADLDLDPGGETSGGAGAP